MNDKPFSAEEFKEIYSRVPRFCIEAIVRSPDGVLLALRKSGGWENMWHFTGSMLLLNESFEDAVHRIAKNEAGVTVKIVKFLGHMEFHDEAEKRGFGYSVSAGFLCDLVSGVPRPDEGASAIQFFKEIPENTISQQKEFLEKHWDEIKTAW